MDLLKEFEKFNVILNLEIVEHVQNVKLFISSCFKLLNNNGIMFTATLNRSFISYIKAIIGAEYVMRWLPKGTHEWSKFFKPSELENIIEQAGMEMVDKKGFVFNPIS